MGVSIPHEPAEGCESSVEGQLGSGSEAGKSASWMASSCFSSKVYIQDMQPRVVKSTVSNRNKQRWFASARAASSPAVFLAWKDTPRTVELEAPRWLVKESKLSPKGNEGNSHSPHQSNPMSC